MAKRPAADERLWRRRNVEIRDKSVCHVCKKKGLTEEDVFCNSCGFPQGKGTAEQYNFIISQRLKRKHLRETLQHINVSRYFLFIIGINFLFQLRSGDMLSVLFFLILFALFIGLGIWAGKAPFAAILTGLVCYVSINLYFATIDIIYLVNGLVWKIFLTSGFVSVLYMIKESEVKSSELSYESGGVNSEGGFFSTCVKCLSQVKPQSFFCSTCGQHLSIQNTASHKKNINGFLISFAIILIYLIALRIVGYQGSTFTNLTVDVVFLLIVLFQVKYFLNDVRETIKWMRLRVGNLFFYLGIQAAITVATLSINASLSDDGLKYSYMEPYMDTPFSLFFALLSVAVFPALTEELAFRAILFNRLQKLTSVYATVVCTAVLFGVVHFSFISFIWLFPAGLFLGWIRTREKTIWYGVICHFFHNSVVVLLEYFTTW